MSADTSSAFPHPRKPMIMVGDDRAGISLSWIVVYSMALDCLFDIGFMGQLKKAVLLVYSAGLDALSTGKDW